MAATHIYYSDIERAGRRLRITLARPGSNRTLLVPAWGADPAIGSTYIRIPDGAIALGAANPTSFGELPQGSDAKFTGNKPLGLAETTTYAISVAHEHLQSTTALQDLSSYLLADYIAFSVDGLDNVTGIGDRFPNHGRSFDIATVVTIMHDTGIAAMDVEDFDIRFQGVPRLQPGRKGVIRIGIGCRVDYDLYHIGRAVMEAVTMEDVCARMYMTPYGSGATASPRNGPGSGGFAHVYDLLWDISGDAFAWMHKPKDQRAFLFHRAHLMYAAQYLCSQVYAAYLGEYGAVTVDTTDTTGWRFRFRGNGESATAYHATPWDHWTYYKQDHTAANDQGAALNARTETYFLGLISLAATPTDHKAGLLLGRDANDSLWSLGTVWDFLVEACNEAGTKGVVRMADAETCEVWLHRLDDTTATAVTLSIDDLLTKGAPTDRAMDVEFEIGTDAVRGVDAAPRVAYGDDVPQYTTRVGTESEGGATVKAIFDTLPVIADQARWWVTAATHDGVEYERAAYRFTWPMWKLYYIDTPFGATNECAVRVHDTPAMHTGSASHSVAVASITLPDLSAIGGVVLGREIFEAIAARQRAGGNLATIATLINARYSGNLVTWRVTLSDAVASDQWLGNTYAIGSHAGSILSTGQSYLNGIPTDGALVSAKVDDVTGLVECTILAS